MRKLPTQEQSKSSTESGNANDPTKKVNENEEHSEVCLLVTRLSKNSNQYTSRCRKACRFSSFPDSGSAEFGVCPYLAVIRK